MTHDADRLRILERLLAVRDAHLIRMRRGLADACTRNARLLAAIELVRPMLDDAARAALDAVLEREDLQPVLAQPRPEVATCEAKPR